MREVTLKAVKRQGADTELKKYVIYIWYDIDNKWQITSNTHDYILFT